jgi:hypothetical protein
MNVVSQAASLLALFSTLAAAQAGDLFKKIPAGVEESLRARVTEFYNLQMQGKFRASEACVCTDTRDYYYDMRKKSPRSFEITKLEFANDLKTATVVVTLGGEIVTMAGPMPVVAPVGTSWKIEDEKWCFYVSEKQQNTIRTPFGEFPVQKVDPQKAKPATPSTGLFSPVTAADVLNAVRFSTDTVVFDATKSGTAEIQFTNTLPGKVTLTSTTPAPAGVEIKLSTAQLESKGSATVQFIYTPGKTAPQKELIVYFEVEPTRQRIAIRLRFELPKAVPTGQAAPPVSPAKP